MHESGLIQNALDLAVAAAETHGPARIDRLLLRVGAFSGVVPEALLLAFDVLRTGTIAAQATLEIETVAVRCRCPNCDDEFVPPALDMVCQRCGETRTEMVTGRELELVSVEVTDL